MNIEEKVLELIQKNINNIGINIDEIKYIKENNIWFLRIVIDKIPYITTEDCENVTKIINPILDKENVINESYILDVCSKERG